MNADVNEEEIKKLKRFRSRHVKSGDRKENERSELQEMTFLRDLHFGFLPDDCETVFAECFAKLADDTKFACKCFRLALLSRNEDLVRVLLNHLFVFKENFHEINSTYLDSLLLLEAVEQDDLESIQSVLAWRDGKGSELGLTDVDKRLLKLQKPAQEVIISAAVKNNYKIIKVLYGDGYKIAGPTLHITRGFSLFKRDPSTLIVGEDMMESQIERIRKFKAMASPAYMAMTYEKDPIEHSFDFSKKAQNAMWREPEFKTEFESVMKKCSNFAVNILDSCRNSSEVEQVLNGASSTDRPYARLYRALHEDQKEFVAHPYCQVLLHSKWLRGTSWSSQYLIYKIIYITLLIIASPILCLLYILSPYRDHSKMNNWLGWFLKILDRPLNRYILDMASYGGFLIFLLLSVIYGIGDHKSKHRTWYFNLATLWVFCYTIKLVSYISQVFFGRITLNQFRFFFDLITILMFLTAISFKIYGYEFAMNLTGGLLMGRTEILNVYHPINIAANIYGVACCMAFLKVIFLFEIHHRFGPILYCIKNVFWDITSIVLSYVITVFAFGIGLVSVFGVFDDESTQFPDFQSAFKRLFWIIFDPGKEEYADIIPPEPESDNCCCNGGRERRSTSNPGVSLARPLPRPNSSIEFATIRPYSEDGDKLSHGFGIYIWAFYQVFVVLIMMNLLISLMTTTFSRIQRNADREWKFSRASIWIHYYDDLNSIPAPFNIIPSVYSLIRLFKWFSGGVYFHTKTWNASVLMSREHKRRLYDTLIERVFRSEEKKMDSLVGKSDIDNLEKEIAIDISDLRRDIRNLRRDLGLPVKEYITSKVGYPVGKISKAQKFETLSLDHSMLPPSQLILPKLNLSKYSLAPESKSFKVDDNPEVVRNLVQTLGLFGFSSCSLDKIVPQQNGEKERHNSLV